MNLIESTRISIKITRMKKVLCLIDSLASGGAQRQMVGLAQLLKQKGYEVKVVTYYDIPFYLQQLQETNVDYEYVPCRAGVLDRLRRIGRTIKRFEPDTVISYLDTPNILACLLHITNKRRWRLIVSERNTTQRLLLRDRFKFALYRFADYIVSNSFSQGDVIANHFPQLIKKSQVITNFVDTDVFCPGIKTDSKVLRIIGVGRILKQKNIPMLIEAVNNVYHINQQLRVDWYGQKFDSYEKCMQLIKQYGLENIFAFHDACSNIIVKYQESDLFVLPSIYEGFPNVLCEAMSCGLPVIATDVCDNGRIVRHEKNGYLIPSGDANQLGERLLQFMKLSVEQRNVMGETSRDIAVELFSRKTFVKEYIKLLD